MFTSTGSPFYILRSIIYDTIEILIRIKVYVVVASDYKRYLLGLKWVPHLHLVDNGNISNKYNNIFCRYDLALYGKLDFQLSSPWPADHNGHCHVFYAFCTMDNGIITCLSKRSPSIQYLLCYAVLYTSLLWIHAMYVPQLC
jgi:hypothetical protein